MSNYKIRSKFLQADIFCYLNLTELLLWALVVSSDTVKGLFKGKCATVCIKNLYFMIKDHQ